MNEFKTMGDMVAPVFGLAKCFEATANFRFMKRLQNFSGDTGTFVRILQQAWICRNTGEV